MLCVLTLLHPTHLKLPLCHPGRMELCRRTLRKTGESSQTHPSLPNSILLFCTRPDHASNPRLTAKWTLLQQHITGNTQVFVVVPPHPLFFSLHQWCPSCAIHRLFFLMPCSHHSKHNQSEAKQKLLAKWWGGGGLAPARCSCVASLSSSPVLPPPPQAVRLWRRTTDQAAASCPH